MSPVQVDRFRDMLLEERQRVLDALNYLREENPGSLEDETGDLVSSSADNHLGDMATETFDRELDYTLEESNERVLGEIDAALARIEAGTYGRCEVCGKEIGEERLEAIPYTRLCIEHSRKR
jgi:DnaK suppressor protein